MKKSIQKKTALLLALALTAALGTVALAAGEKSITVTPMAMTINGQAVTPLKSDGTPAEVFAYEGATYVPLRYLSELLGIGVEWDANDSTTAKLVGDNLKVPAAGAATLTGEGQGFGGTITASLTMENGVVTACTLTGASETPAIGGAALDTLAAQVVAAGGAGIDGVSGATLTSNGVKAAVENALTGKTAEPEKPATVEIDYRDPDVKAIAARGAKIAQTTVYGVYSLEGDAVDSAIRTVVTYDRNRDKVLNIDFDEALLPCAQGGAEGWAVVDGKSAPAFIVGDVIWTGAEKEGATTYSAKVDGKTVDFVDYVATQAGGEWYYAHLAEGAKLLDKSGKEVGTVSIGTKASIEHGVHFWVSPITFPGNIELIKNFIYDNGVHYDYAPQGDDMVKNADGVWEVCDTVTGATLAGTPNYFNLVKQACEKIAAGNYTLVK